MFLACGLRAGLLSCHETLPGCPLHLHLHLRLLSPQHAGLGADARGRSQTTVRRATKAQPSFIGRLRTTAALGSATLARGSVMAIDDPPVFRRRLCFARILRGQWRFRWRGCSRGRALVSLSLSGSWWGEKVERGLQALTDSCRCQRNRAIGRHRNRSWDGLRW